MKLWKKNEIIVWRRNSSKAFKEKGRLKFLGVNSHRRKRKNRKKTEQQIRCLLSQFDWSKRNRGFLFRILIENYFNHCHLFLYKERSKFDRRKQRMILSSIRQRTEQSFRQIKRNKRNFLRDFSNSTLDLDKFSIDDYQKGFWPTARIEFLFERKMSQREKWISIFFYFSRMEFAD